MYDPGRTPLVQYSTVLYLLHLVGLDIGYLAAASPRVSIEKLGTGRVSASWTCSRPGVLISLVSAPDELSSNLLP